LKALQNINRREFGKLREDSLERGIVSPSLLHSRRAMLSDIKATEPRFIKVEASSSNLMLPSGSPKASAVEEETSPSDQSTSPSTSYHTSKREEIIQFTSGNIIAQEPGKREPPGFLTELDAQKQSEMNYYIFLRKIIDV